MTIDFTNDECQYLYTDSDMKLKVKENAPEEMKGRLADRVKTFNNWISEIDRGRDKE